MRDTITVPAALFVEVCEKLQAFYDNSDWHNNPLESKLEPLLTLAQVPRLHFEGREWTHRSTSNTYQSIRIHVNGKDTHSLGMTYSYGDQWLYRALNWLAANHPHMVPGYVGHNPTQYMREVIQATYEMHTVDKERDL